MPECSMTLHSCSGYAEAMSSWEIEYLRHVERETGKSLSAIAKMAGVSSTTLTRPVNNPDHPYKVKLATLEAVERETGIPFAPFRGGAAVPARVENGEAWDNGDRLVPVYDLAASAGDGSFVGYEGIAYSLAFPPDYIRRVTRADPKNLTIISVKGDSMVPTLYDDDIVMLDMSKTSLGYEGLFVIRVFDVLHVKRLSHSRPGHVLVISDNRDNYPPREHPIEEVEVVGKVIWKGGKV